MKYILTLLLLVGGVVLASVAHARPPQSVLDVDSPAVMRSTAPPTRSTASTSTGCTCPNCRCTNGECGCPDCPSLKGRAAVPTGQHCTCPSCGCSRCLCVADGKCICPCCGVQNQPAAPAPSTFKLLFDRAMTEDRPLVMWIAEVCPPCEAKMRGYVHAHLEDYEGDATPRVIVGRPNDKGGMDRLATFPGIPDTEQIKAAARGTPTPAPAPAQPVPVSFFRPAPMPMFGGGMPGMFGGGIPMMGGFGGGMMGGGGGGC